MPEENNEKIEEQEEPLKVPEPEPMVVKPIDHTKSSNIDDDLGNQLTGTEKDDLTDGGETVLHTHAGSSSLSGDGTDGAKTVSTDETLTADVFYTSLTVNATKTLNPGGFRIFCTGEIINNGTISQNGDNGNNGANASGSTGGVGGTANGTAVSDGSLPGILDNEPGGQGGNSDNGGIGGDAGVAKAKCLGGAAGAGGSGGNGGVYAGSGTNGGIAGTAGASSGTVYNTPRSPMGAYILYDAIDDGKHNISPSSGGAGGGGGGNTGTSGAGGGGGGGASGQAGGIVWISAKTITNNGTISANGGTGGNGGDGGDATGAGGGGGGGGGTGGGGGGGTVIIMYKSKTGDAPTATKGSHGATFGRGGAGIGGGDSGIDGSHGADGGAGIVISIET